MTAVVGERSMDRLTCNFEKDSTDDDGCGDSVWTSDELAGGVAGEADKCEAPVIWEVRGDGGMIGRARFGL